MPAWEMIRFSINIMRGCFGGCTFCSITAHQGRIIQSRSQKSVLNEIRQMTDNPDFKGVVSTLRVPDDTNGALMDPNEVHEPLIESIIEVDEGERQDLERVLGSPAQEVRLAGGADLEAALQAGLTILEHNESRPGATRLIVFVSWP